MEDYRFAMFSIIYLLVGVIFIIFFVKNKHRDENNFGYNGIFFGIIIYYIAVPIILFLNIDKFMAYEKLREIYGNNSIYKYVYNANSNYFLLALFLIVLFFVFFNIGYKMSRKRDKFKEIEINYEKLETLIKVFIYITFIVGAFSLVLFFNAFGGLQKALSMAEYLRSFSNETSDVIGKYSLLFISARLITVTPFLLAYYMEKYKNKKYMPYYIAMYIISIILSIMYFAFYAGRFPLICFLMSIFYIMIKNRVKHPWRLIVIMGIIGLPLLDVFDKIFVLFSTGRLGKLDINYVRYLYQFVYPIRTVINVIPITQRYGVRYFKDLILGPLDILPGVTIDPSYMQTSEYFHGIHWKEIGGIPNDVVSFGYYQFNILGIIFFALILGWLIQKIDIRMMKIDNNSKFYMGANISILCFNLAVNCDTVSFVKGQFFLIIIYVILMLSTKKEVKK